MVKGKGKLEAVGRYIDGDKVRFSAGQPQKIGGWAKYGTAPFSGIARAAHSWNDLTSRTVTAIGTTRKLYALDGSNNPVDITPAQQTISLTSAFTTTNGSNVVTVSHTAHGKIIGQVVTFSSTSATVGGLTMDGAWTITGTPSTGTYTFQHTSAATSGAGPAANTTATYDIPPGAVDPAGGYGYGVGNYGQGTYGTARSTTNIFFEPYTWSISNFGKMLLGAPFNGTLYAWDPTTIPTPRATPVANAPGAMRGMFVTPERFVIALGASADTSTTYDPLLVRWCSQGDYTDWIASTTNTANSRRVTEGKKLMGGGALGQGLSLLWTDTALYAHQYTGSRFIFDTRLVGTSAGLAGPHAFTFAQGRAYWFGSSAFYTYASGIGRVPKSEEVAEWLLGKLRAHYEPKTLCFYNERFNEVWWIFVTDEDSEPTIYCAYDIDGQSWITGTLTRTAATRQDGGDTRPLLAGTDGYIYLHENGTDADGAAMDAWIQSGPFQLEEGQTKLAVIGYVPDYAKHEGDLQITIDGRDRANTRVIDRNLASVGPDEGLIDLRIRARVVSFKLQSKEIGGDFAMGAHAFEVMSGGKKR